MPELRIPRRDLPPLRGNGVDSFWAALPAVTLAEVTTGATPCQATNVRAAWRETELRILFHAVDADPWATLTERDAPLYTEEVVEVLLDPVGDLAGYFEIEVNPRNAVLDLVLRRNRSGVLKDFRWRCEGLQTRVWVVAGAWIAELSIPFAAVTPDPPVPGTRWRANFCRIDRPKGRERELTAWSPTGLPQFHVPERFGILEFSG